MRIAALVPAAGRGERLGPGTPKALRMLGGVPLLVHAVRALCLARQIDLVVVAAPPGDVVAVRALFADYDLPAEVSVIGGGDSRQESVRLALATLPADVEFVLVHDAARPLVPEELIDCVAAAVRDGADAVVPGLPVSDTVKRVDAGAVVAETLDRSVLRAIQTPQGFRRTVLEAAHARVVVGESNEATDDAGLVEATGCPVIVVPGSDEAFKVTRPLDLVLAEAILARRRSAVAH